eukprot:421935-Amphidinium_carterae.1
MPHTQECRERIVTVLKAEGDVRLSQHENKWARREEEEQELEGWVDADNLEALSIWHKMSDATGKWNLEDMLGDIALTLKSGVALEPLRRLQGRVPTHADGTDTEVGGGPGAAPAGFRVPTPRHEATSLDIPVYGPTIPRSFLTWITTGSRYTPPPEHAQCSATTAFKGSPLGRAQWLCHLGRASTTPS